MPDALDSLFGAGHAAATTRALAMPGVRNQRVHTPQCIWDGLYTLWGEVEYDPAGSPESLGKVKRSTETRGLLDPWVDKTFCNPPYGYSLRDPEKELPLVELASALKAAADGEAKARSKALGLPVKSKFKLPPELKVKKTNLGDWLAKQHESRIEAIMLVPMRTHRVWFRQWYNRLDAKIGLDPLCFDGHKQSFPAPLVLGYTVGRITRSSCREVARFERTFAHLGSPI